MKPQKTISKIIAVLIALIVWIFVIYSENPSLDQTINSINVTLTNESILSEQNLMVVNKTSISDASVVIRGRRQDLINVMGNISANVDLSQITEPGTYRLQPSFDIPSNAVYISKRNTRFIEVSVENITEKLVDVYVSHKNADKNKSFIVESLPQVNKIEIRGSQSDISAIDHARVTIDVSSMSEDITDNYAYILEDENNSEVLPINEIFSQSNITVINNIYDKVALPISLSIPTAIGDNYTIKLVSQEKTDIDAGIKNQSGKRVTELTAIFNIEELTKGTQKYELPIIQPDGIYLPEESKYITVELEVAKNTTKEN